MPKFILKYFKALNFVAGQGHPSVSKLGGHEYIKLHNFRPIIIVVKYSHYLLDIFLKLWRRILISGSDDLDQRLHDQQSLRADLVERVGNGVDDDGDEFVAVRVENGGRMRHQQVADEGQGVDFHVGGRMTFAVGGEEK